MRLPYRRAVRLLVLLAVGMIGTALIGLATPAAAAEPARVEEQRLDGAGVALDTSLYLPATTPAPAVLVAHGFGGTKASVDADARDLAARGFVVLTWTARGFGASGGQIALDAPDAEVADARKLVDWLATRPEVLQDGPGDPRVGVTGGSYGGALSLMLAGYDQRVDAIAPVITWNDLAQALFPNAATAEPLPADTPARGAFAPNGVFKRGWAGVFFASGRSAQPPPGTVLTCGRFTPAVCAAYTEAATTGRISRRHRGAARPLLPRVGHRPDHGAHPARPGRAGHAVRPRPGRRQRPPDRRARHPGQGHLVSAAGTTAEVPTRPSATQIGDWFDQWLVGGETAPDLGFSATPCSPGCGRGPTRRPDARSRRRITRASAAPPRRPGRTSRCPATRKSLLSPGGRQPRRDHVAARPRWRARRGAGSGSRRSQARAPRPVRRSSASAPVAAPLLVAGAPRVQLTVARVPGQPAPDGGRAVRGTVSRSPRTAPARCSAARSRRCGWPCPPTGPPRRSPSRCPGSSRRSRRAHRCRVGRHHGPGLRRRPPTRPCGGSLGVDAAGLVRAGRARRGRHRQHRAARARARHRRGAGCGAARVAAARCAPRCAAVPTARRRRRTPQRADRCRSRSRPRQDLPRRVQRGDGRVLRRRAGHGARPARPERRGQDHRAAHAHGPDPAHRRARSTAFGEPVGPGAPVLARIGAFVEGPGFLPHLSGLENLRLYWAATGRPDRGGAPRRRAGDRRARRARSTAASAPTARACASGSRSPRPCSGCPSCWCSTSRRTGSTRRRSTPCARCCALRRGRAHGAGLQPPAGRGRADLLARRGDAPGRVVASGHRRRDHRRAAGAASFARRRARSGPRPCSGDLDGVRGVRVDGDAVHAELNGTPRAAAVRALVAAGRRGARRRVPGAAWRTRSCSWWERIWSRDTRRTPPVPTHTARAVREPPTVCASRSGRPAVSTYVPSRTLPVRVELVRQLRRRRTQIAFGAGRAAAGDPLDRVRARRTPDRRRRGDARGPGQGQRRELRGVRAVRLGVVPAGRGGGAVLRRHGGGGGVVVEPALPAGGAGARARGCCGRRRSWRGCCRSPRSLLLPIVALRGGRAGLRRGRPGQPHRRVAAVRRRARAGCCSARSTSPCT